jgi:hypothetical protein
VPPSLYLAIDDWELPVALESAIMLADGLAGATLVREHLARSTVYTLGRLPAEFAASGSAPESDILHFRAGDQHSGEHMVTPVFTRPEAMSVALRSNPAWNALTVIAVQGGSLLENLDLDVTVVINPWTPLEFHVPVAGWD